MSSNLASSTPADTPGNTPGGTPVTPPDERPMFVGIDVLAPSASASWSAVSERVVVHVGPDVSIRMSPAQARTLAQELVLAADGDVDELDDDKIYSGLNAEQADGLACVRCGRDFVHVDGATRQAPVGRSETAQVFACDPGCYARETGIADALVDGARNLGAES